jgi:hypothetical protein
MSKKGSDLAATVAFVLFMVVLILLMLARCTGPS